MGKDKETVNDESGDFNEEQVSRMLARSPFWNKISHRWISVGTGNLAAIRMNWVTFLLATAITWGCAFYASMENTSSKDFGDGKKWVAQNFTWMYILTQDVWCMFLIYLCFSRFAHIKLGRDDEKPRFNDFAWFCMLFTCGVAVGLYVFGVAEPLYFYRQPSSWMGGWESITMKTGAENDAMRAQQAIFMAVYHWGIHGWVPYILLALLVGIVSFRWNMPMTIRSCFYPLLGDHSLGMFGDFIDALSIATTTFGVCTSLALGVSQLSSGLGKFLYTIGGSCKDRCIKAGGTWDINTYGANSCVSVPAGAVVEACKAGWLSGSADDEKLAYTIIILLVTALATLSVLSGLKNGIKMLSKIAFSFGLVVMMGVLISDNTWYLLSVMVQTLGYYIQYVIQVGFDCEAFQQLGYEFKAPGPNHFWGSQAQHSVYGKLSAAGINMPATVADGDCGMILNPCKKGVISFAMASALGMATSYSTHTASALDGYKGTAATTALHAMGMSHDSISLTGSLYQTMHTTYGGAPINGIPCGSGWDTSKFDPWTREMLPTSYGGANYDAANPPSLCAGAIDVAACTASAMWSGRFPKCPTTVAKDTPDWGMCSAHTFSCSPAQAYYEDTNPAFMDWWTIFYWAWWITWAPFVGFFVAMISRGRTVREVIIGGFICPTLFAIMWFGVFGGLAIKMERTAEIALQVRPDIGAGSVTCSEHYSGGAPITPEAKKLAEAGYYMLTCLPKDDQIYRVMEPYMNIDKFLQVFLWLGLIIYFLTSSDSGSMTDDIISAAGLSPSRIPSWQKVFWCWTEGLVAILLISQGGKDGKAINAGSKSLQALSIIIGLPYTIFLCLFVPSLYRVLKKEAGDEDIHASKRFNTQILDFLEFFRPQKPSPFKPCEHVFKILTGLLFPFVGIKAALTASGSSGMTAMMYAISAQTLWLGWFIMQCMEAAATNMCVISWLCYFGFCLIAGFARTEMRRAFNVWGSPVDDFTLAVSLYPFTIAQIHMQAERDAPELQPGYFESADELIAEMAEVMPGGAGASSSSTSSSSSSSNKEMGTMSSAA